MEERREDRTGGGRRIAEETIWGKDEGGSEAAPPACRTWELSQFVKLAVMEKIGAVQWLSIPLWPNERREEEEEEEECFSKLISFYGFELYM